MTGTVLRGATVVDGTGAPARQADVVIEAGRIRTIEPAGSVGHADVVDLDGLVLAPGFIDAHTHYDAQVLWDPDLTPSSWHGVTSVVLGNCGFGVAPTRPSAREQIARTLENVEGMSFEALRAGIEWSFESFPEYLQCLARVPKRLNVGAMIGHTPLRLYVMGNEATQRAATPAEIEQMRSILGEALAAGALGFATSANPGHVGAFGQPVPSRLAELGEIAALVGVLGESRRGTFQATVGPTLFVDELARLADATGRPVTWTFLAADDSGFGRPANAPVESALDVLERTRRLPGEVYPQVACRPVVMQITLADPLPFGSAEAFKEIFRVSHDRRVGLYRDPAWRARARRDVDDVYPGRFARIFVDETTHNGELLGLSIDEIARRRGVAPLDAMCDVALRDNLGTRFRFAVRNYDEAVLAQLLRDPLPLITLSDAGAHASQLCDACWSTWLLEHWVRERSVLSLEQAVHRLTGHPATVYRLEGRGVLREGFAADLVAFDPATIAIEPAERVRDLPGGADRLVVRSRGIEHVWVNGEPIRWAGQERIVAPGALLVSQVE